MPHIISTLCPGASGAVRNELSNLNLDHVTGGGTTSTIVTGMTADRQRSADKAMANMNAYLRG